MISIEGGAPSGKHNIRLGDIVIDYPIKKEDSVVSYNFGKAVQDREFERTGSLNSPPTVLLTALTKLSADHERKGSHITESVRLIIVGLARSFPCLFFTSFYAYTYMLESSSLLLALVHVYHNY